MIFGIKRNHQRTLVQFLTMFSLLFSSACVDDKSENVSKSPDSGVADAIGQNEVNGSELDTDAGPTTGEDDNRGDGGTIRQDEEDTEEDECPDCAECPEGHIIIDDGTCCGQCIAEERPTAQACFDFQIIEACDNDPIVTHCWENVDRCTQNDDPRAPSCFEDADCGAGVCRTDMMCNSLQADCVENAGHPDAADCLRLFINCVEEGSRSDGECGSLVNTCIEEFPDCE